MGKKHGFTPKYSNVQAPTAIMSIRQHSRCHYKRDSGFVPAGMNNLHTKRPAGRRTPSGPPPSAPTAAATTSVPGGKTAAATASGQTLWRKSSCPPRTRTSHSSQGDGGPGVQAELAISSAEKPSQAATTSAPTAASTCPPTPHQRASAAPKRTGRSSLSSSPREREWDRPRTRVPPSRRTTCCETPWCDWPLSPGQRTECCTLAGQQQFAFPSMAGGRLLRGAGGRFPPPEAGGRSGMLAHAEAGPGSACPLPQQG
jgi:hypothetical protein